MKLGRHEQVGGLFDLVGTGSVLPTLKHDPHVVGATGQVAQLGLQGTHVTSVLFWKNFGLQLQSGAVNLFAEQVRHFTTPPSSSQVAHYLGQS